MRRFRSLPALAAAGALVALLASRASALQNPPSRDFEDYVLIGLTSIHLDSLAHVVSGGVAVNTFGADDATLGRPGTLYLSHHVTFEPAATPVANTVRIGNLTRAGDVFANHFMAAYNASAGAAHPFDPAAGRTVFAELPALPAFDCPSDSALGAIVLGREEQVTLQPGIFRDLFLRDGAHITLTGGVYQFDSVRLGKRAVLMAQAPATINVCGSLRISNQALFLSGTDTAKGLLVNVAGPRVVLNAQNLVTAIVLAPNAHLQLGGPNELRGQFVANVVTSDAGVELICDTGGKGCTTTTTTVPGGGTTTTTLRPASTTTTTTPTGGATTTTVPGHAGIAEICGNCVDDDGDGLTDFEDPDCCAASEAVTMSVSRGRIRRGGRTSFLRLRSLLAAAGLSSVDPYHQDVFLQLRPAGGTELLCARIPASHFMRMHGNPKFWDHRHTVASAQGIDDLTVHFEPGGGVRLRTLGRKVRFTAPGGGPLQVTVGFRDMMRAGGDRSTNRCSRTTQAFRRTTTGALRAP